MGQIYNKLLSFSVSCVLFYFFGSLMLFINLVVKIVDGFPLFVSLLKETGLHPEEAIDKVTTPGGVTIKGLNELDHCGFNSAVIKSLKAGLK